MRKQPNIILIVLDGVRATHLGCYGFHKPTSSNIDKLAQNGVLFKNAFSCINCTNPSITAITSGKYPSSNGIVRHISFNRPEELNKLHQSKTKFIAEILKSYGYMTLGIDWLGKWHKRGYNHYGGVFHNSQMKSIASRIADKLYFELPSYVPLPRNSIVKNFIMGDAYEITNTAIKLLKDRRARSFFLFIHYRDTHTPYIMSDNKHIEKMKKFESKGESIKEILGRFNNPLKRKTIQFRTRNAGYVGEVVTRYDAAISFIDEEIGRLINFLETRGLMENTLIVITADHGESFWEHEIHFSHHGLYDVSIHVPLILSYPRLPTGITIDGLVQSVDIVPTILNIAGLGYKNINFDGKNLLPMIENNKIPGRSVIYVEEAQTQRKRAIRTGEFKYIQANAEKDAICRECGYIHGGIREFYDLEKDPYEMYNILADEDNSHYDIPWDEIKELWRFWHTN